MTQTRLGIHLHRVHPMETHRLHLLALSWVCMLGMTTTSLAMANTEPPPDEIALGWRYHECAVQYHLWAKMEKSEGDTKKAERSDKLRQVAISTSQA